jgi:hypothetical protein
MADIIIPGEINIDLRDVIERYEELEALAPEAGGTGRDEEQEDEFQALTELLDDLKDRGGDHHWRGSLYPIQLIREDHFEDHARDLAADLHGRAIEDAEWPFGCIDWEKATDELKIDYASVDFGGEDYLYR